jgi:hypothetical protein
LSQRKRCLRTWREAMRRARQPHIAANIAKLPELSKIEEAANCGGLFNDGASFSLNENRARTDGQA